MNSLSTDSTPFPGQKNEKNGETNDMKNKEKTDEKNNGKSDEKSDFVGDMSEGNESLIYAVSEALTNDDFLCLKMLCGLWLTPSKTNKVKRSDVKTAMILFKALHNRMKIDADFHALLIELLLIIKRYDLLKKFKLCKHNAAKSTKNRISPTWKECFKLVDQFNPNGKEVESFKTNLITLIQSEEKQRRDCMVESLTDLIDQTILDDVQRKLDDLSDLPYALEGDPCGICLIINNKTFADSTKFPTRDGTEADKATLETLFTDFCFEVRTHDDCSSVEMKKHLTSLAEENHSSRSCVVIFILSHGEEGFVVGVDGKLINIEKDIMGVFNSKSSLAGKPKLFFIQACQGNSKLRPVSEPVEAGEHSLPPQYMDNLSPDSVADLASDAPASHPARSDYLLCLPTVEGCEAYRNKNSGTWFVLSLAKMLRLYGTQEDIMVVLRKVNNHVAAQEGRVDGEKVKQQPIQKTTLRKQLVFKKKVCKR